MRKKKRALVPPWKGNRERAPHVERTTVLRFLKGGREGGHRGRGLLQSGGRGERKDFSVNEGDRGGRQVEKKEPADFTAEGVRGGERGDGIAGISSSQGERKEGYLIVSTGKKRDRGRKS